MESLDAARIRMNSHHTTRVPALSLPPDWLADFALPNSAFAQPKLTHAIDQSCHRRSDPICVLAELEADGGGMREFGSAGEELHARRDILTLSSSR